MIKYQYLRDRKGRLRGCLAVDSQTERLGFSLCHPSDQFRKVEARYLALSRLQPICEAIKTLPGSCVEWVIEKYSRLVKKKVSAPEISKLEAIKLMMDPAKNANEQCYSVSESTSLKTKFGVLSVGDYVFIRKHVWESRASDTALDKYEMVKLSVSEIKGHVIQVEKTDVQNGRYLDLTSFLIS